MRIKMPWRAFSDSASVALDFQIWGLPCATASSSVEMLQRSRVNDHFQRSWPFCVNIVAFALLRWQWVVFRTTLTDWTTARLPYPHAGSLIMTSSLPGPSPSNPTYLLKNSAPSLPGLTTETIHLSRPNEKQPFRKLQLFKYSNMRVCTAMTTLVTGGFVAYTSMYPAHDTETPRCCYYSWNVSCYLNSSVQPQRPQ